MDSPVSVPVPLPDDGLCRGGNSGGSCVVGFDTTAWGSSFRYSSSNRLAFVKNGSYYDVDKGVEPDFVIGNYRNFFDREALTKFIQGLY